MREDPNYNEVSMEVDMYVEGCPRKSISFLRQIFLVIKIFWYKLIGRKEKYKPEPSDLMYVHVKNLNERKMGEMQTSKGLYIVRNRITGSVIITNGTVESLKKMYNGNDYEIVEPMIKD